MDEKLAEHTEQTIRDPYWSARTVDHAFIVALLVATIALPILFVSFLDSLLFAVVVVVVSWPLYERIYTATGQRKGVAAGLTTLALGLIVLVPLAVLGTFGVAQAIVLVGQAVDFIQGGGVEHEVAALVLRWQPVMDRYLAGYLPSDFDPVVAVAAPVQRGALALLQAMSRALPNMVAATVRTGIDLLIFGFAVITLFMEGPAVARVIKRLVPIADRYQDDLFRVFSQFASNMVLGSLASAVVQGFVAGIGYAIAGAPLVVLWAVLTAVGSFIPVVGTLVVWGPVALYVLFTHGIGWAVFLVLWSLLLTGTLDNVVKGLVLGGGTSIHPLLIFLGMFGGLSWMGLPGLFVGPVIVAFFLALYTIYIRDFRRTPSDPIPTEGARP